MKNESFKIFVLEQLRELEGIECRHLFNGFGLYHSEKFFGIISSKGRLYFKTNPKTAKQYIAFGMQPFRPSAKQTLKNYYEVPAEVIDDPHALAEWARKAIYSICSSLTNCIYAAHTTPASVCV